MEFQKLWVGSLPFPLKLLSKFLDDMELMAQDATPATEQQLRRLLALASCFVAVLQSTASGVLELSQIDLLAKSFEQLLARLLICFKNVGVKFGDFRWTNQAANCLIILADFLKEKFAGYYELAIDVLLSNLVAENIEETLKQRSIVGLAAVPFCVARTPGQIQELLKANLHLLRSQGLSLIPSNVDKVVGSGSVVSILRLHPSRLVTGIVAATYLFLLQHVSIKIVMGAAKCVEDELERLKMYFLDRFGKAERPSFGMAPSTAIQKSVSVKPLSESEAISLFKFDLAVLVSSFSTGISAPSSSHLHACTCEGMEANYIDKLISQKLSPFEDPIQWYSDLQLALIQALRRLWSLRLSKKPSGAMHDNPQVVYEQNTEVYKSISRVTGIDCLNQCSWMMARGLDAHASLPVKVEVLEWIANLAEDEISGGKYLSSHVWQSFDNHIKENLCRTMQGAGIGYDLLRMLIAAAGDREPRVRGRVATVLELLLQAELIGASQLEAVAGIALERLGDPEVAIQGAYMSLLSLAAPGALWIHGWLNNDSSISDKPILSSSSLRDSKCGNWKQVFAIRHFSQYLRPQQLVSILSYITQRSQIFPSSWLQRLFHCSPGHIKLGHSRRALEKSLVGQDGGLIDVKHDTQSLELDVGVELLERSCASSNLVAAWWAVNEAARHCITVKLRTHLGGPTQTFAAIERILLEIPQQVQTELGQREGFSSPSISNLQLLPMRLLLEFVEGLQKNIYNAYEGSVILPTPQPASVLFFRANKKVCEEWFARIREALMNASAAIQCHSAAFHYAMLRLQDLRGIAATAVRETVRTQSSDTGPNLKIKVQQDVLRVIRNASIALCRAHDADGLLGLQTWAASTFGPLISDDVSSIQKVSSQFGPLGWITGLTLQAKGQYERAAAHFTNLLQSEEALVAMGADNVQFTIARTIECYVALADWDSLDAWLQDLQNLRVRNAGKAYAGSLTTAGNDMNAIHAMSRFDAGDVVGTWGYLDLTPQSSIELTIDPRQALQRSEQMLLQAMLRKESTNEEKGRELKLARSMIEEVLNVSAFDGVFDAAPLTMQLECINVFEAGTGISSSRYGNIRQDRFLSILPLVMGSSLDALHQDSLLWLKLLRVYRTVYPKSLPTLQLQLQLARLARRQSNYRLAYRLLQEVPNSDSVTFEDGKESSNWLNWKFLLGRFLYEQSLLLFSDGKHEEAIGQLWCIVSSYIPFSESVPVGEVDLLKAKACLKFSSWLKQRSFYVPSESLLSGLELKGRSGHIAGSSVKIAEVFSSVKNLGPYLRPVAILEELIGAGIKAATLLFPGMARAWFSYASWCFAHAKNSFIGTSTIHEPLIFPKLLEKEFSPVASSFLEKDVEYIRSLLQTAVQEHCKKVSGGKEWISRADFQLLSSSDVSNHVEAFVQRVLYLMQAASGSNESADSSAESPVMLLSKQLHQELQMLDYSGSAHVVSEIMNIWWKQRKVSMFGCAARGFLQYLSMSMRKTCNKEGDSSYWHTTVKAVRPDSVLSASLHVLCILQNYGVELEDVFQQGLASVPPSPWQDITSQLFARLSNHPEPKVRKQLEGLLLALANVSPWAIVYPTLVDWNASDGEPSDELRHILDCLINLHPKLVKDVQLMISELGSITVLWEEQWAGTLQDLHSDVTRRISTLKEEAVRVAENQTLSHAEKLRINASKYSAMMSPIVVALERRLISTSRSPETPHEVWFQEHYGSQLKSAISFFKTPPSIAASLGEVWRPLDAIATSLANHQKKSSVLLSDVAPKLAALKCSDAPMPGLGAHIMSLDASFPYVPVGLGKDSNGGNLSEVVTIATFDEQVAILATKTKPKKLSFVGSDGIHYTYLLKGREDLRLDARVMQLLHAVNGMLHSHSITRHHGLAVRNYSVTPISGRAGLIQWVDNVTSIYSVFKSWQQRAHAAHMNSSDISGAPSVPRPSDMFYGKIIPALKEKGLRKVLSRRDWPHEVKRKVLLELMKETPRQLLYRELWCASEGLTAFTLKLKKFSGSVAVMSMIGHVLGLGDRHLDNILVDFTSGDVVHIDYNVCFDKGLRLKIPEIVPFRLTQTMQAALGPTGIEGSFRANCEAVLEALQRNKDVILMLLEVFVWDPLVEWMRGDGHDEATIGGEERKGMELAVSLSIFASHVQEIRVPLQEHQDELLTNLPSVASALQRLAEAYERYERVSKVVFHADQSRRAAAKAEATARIIMSETSSLVEKTRVAYEVLAREFALAKGVVTEAARESTQWVEQHSRVLDALRNNSVPELQAIGQLPGPLEALSLTSAVLAAGVPLTVVPEPAQVHCREVDREVSQYTAAQHEALLHGGRTLQAYALALQRLLPTNYIASSYVHSWAQILQLSMRQFSVEPLAAARRQMIDVVARGRGEHDEAIKQKYGNLRVHVERLLKEIRKLHEDHAELEASLDPDAEQKAKDRVLGIFTRHLQLVNQVKKEEDGTSSAGNAKAEEVKESLTLEIEEKRTKVVMVLQAAAASLFGELGEKIAIIQNAAIERAVFGIGDDLGTQNPRWCLSELQELVERCLLTSLILTEVQQAGIQTSLRAAGSWESSTSVIADWAVKCRACVNGVEDLANQMVGVVLPEAIKASLSRDPAVMEAFANISQIRGAVDTALQQVVQIEIQRSALVELENNYAEKVGEISQRQALLEAAAARGRDHLSWEEAEELATQEELCREQLDQLHRAWAQRGAQATALSRREANVRSSLAETELHFQSLVTIDREGESQVMRGKVLLAAFSRIFSGLESLDQVLSTFGSGIYSSNEGHIDAATTGFLGLESVWKAANILQEKTFFAWKVGIIDVLLDSCIHDASTIDLNFSFEQLLIHQKKKIEAQLQSFLDQYLRERVASVLFELLSKDKMVIKSLTIQNSENDLQPLKKEGEAVKRALRILNEYCDVHETVRAAKAAASSMKVQADEVMQALQNAQLEAAQMEWLHDSVLSRIQPRIQLLGLPSSMVGDKAALNIAWWNRKQLLESLQSAITAITRATEGLQGCDAASVAAEEQLDRAMAWACAGPSAGGSVGSNATRGNGIPAEFHEHLRRRRQLLWSGQEQVAGIMRLCGAVLEFEASRDGVLDIPGVEPSKNGLNDGKAWQQAYQNMIAKLEVACVSFTSSDLEWQATKKKMEAASSSLSRCTEELQVTSINSESVSGEFQAATAELKDCILGATNSVTSLCNVLKTQSALTVESGSMLEEVLAITDGAESALDVHALAKEASGEHSKLMSHLNKISTVMMPLEPMLTSASAAAASFAGNPTISDQQEPKADLNSGHLQVILQSLQTNLLDIVPILNSTVPGLIVTVKQLHVSLMKLARAASSDAGVLHKALEGVGESQAARSQDDAIMTSELAGHDGELSNNRFNGFYESIIDVGNTAAETHSESELLQEDECWISPPESGYTDDVIYHSDNISDTVNLTPTDAPKLVSQATIEQNMNMVVVPPTDVLKEKELGHLTPMQGQSPLLSEAKSQGSDSGRSDMCNDIQTSLLSSTDGSFVVAKQLNNEGDPILASSVKIDKQQIGHGRTTMRSPVISSSTLDHRGRNSRERNPYAVSVLNRVRTKLEGRDTDGNRPLHVSEQVDHLLRQATSIDNLCNMYEGWTPWI
ncbi:hypothetical protein O6H91_03G044300 [Diphasiastrum complanatum]|nr:hypothetical protein O6H91_03G044300 [Diphasiastrum complanatum]